MKQRKPFLPSLSGRTPWALTVLVAVFSALALLPGCKKKEAPQARPPAEVTAIKIEPKDTPVGIEFVGQTASSHQVEIRARVNAFLDKRTYTEGSLVHAGRGHVQDGPEALPGATGRGTGCACATAGPPDHGAAPISRG